MKAEKKVEKKAEFVRQKSNSFETSEKRSLNRRYSMNVWILMRKL